MLSSVIKISAAAGARGGSSQSPPLPPPFPNEPGDAGRTAAANGQLAEGAVLRGLGPASGPKCLLIKSQLRLEPELPPASPRDATHSPLQGGPLGCHSAQPTASRENTSRERQEDMPAQHKGPGVSGRAGGRIPLLDNKGDQERLLCWVLGQASHPSEPQVSCSVQWGGFQSLIHWC